MSAPDTHYVSYGTGRKTIGSYITGLILSLILTCFSFAIVDKHLLTGDAIYIALTLAAVAQLLVQVICFLRLNTTTEGRWNTMSFVFAILIVLILVFGTLWIMYNLNYNMMN